MSNQKENRYRLRDNGEFVISDYNSTKLFSSFFPGVAGKVGIPMWTFYVNRGQCICSMGIEGKHNPIMEFLPANRAYQLVSTQGFRTFIKPLSHDSIRYYEPFQKHLQESKTNNQQLMKISPSQLVLEEVNETLGVKFIVEYFNIVKDDFPALVRRLHIQNISRKNFRFEGLDGLPLIIPYGITNDGLKFVRRLMEAFVEVSNYDTGVPFFRGKVEPSDRPEVVRIKKGNFYVGFEEDVNGLQRITPIVDPVKIFGSQSDFSYPELFLEKTPESLYKGQILENRLPCSMGLIKAEIAPEETYTYTSIIGHAASIAELNELIPKITNTEYIHQKISSNRNLIDELTQKNFIGSSELVLDQYSRQNFLDNTLRGGFPYTLKGNEGSFTIHLFSRKHGDLERDYNDYRLSPSKYSQGNGNFRDVNQNRRKDLLFNPDVQEGNVEQFYNLIQLDGFNPLVIKEKRFSISKKSTLNFLLGKYVKENQIKIVNKFLQSDFTPGELMTFLSENKINLLNDTESFLADLVSNSEVIYCNEYGEGFWTDHWTYNLDLLENFLELYPEDLRYILFEKKDYTFYDNPHRVQPRDDKYVIWDGNPMQLSSVIFDEEKDLLISRRLTDKNKVRTKCGKGKIYTTSLINKMLSIIVNKMASLDPNGVGVEMESDKPNWYDALNGLPGLIGSSINETLEIKRHIIFLMEAFDSLALNGEKWQIFAEMAEFINKLYSLLSEGRSSFDYWEKASSVKENYRDKTTFGISGKEKPITLKYIREFFALCLKKLDEGIEKAWDKDKGVISSYFINQVTDFQEIEYADSNGKCELKRNPRGLVCFRAKGFQQKPLPLFLEGPVHYLRSRPGKHKAARLINSIRNSGLYDKKLKMYKVNESLADQVPEIGRARTFSPGWFENESVWLHMEYKFMLEILRNELYEEFYQDFKKVFVPFFDPNVYGRSILENSSFICSSANPDPSIHGNGFVARLSGATAEFIHILLLMTVGPKPFSMKENGELRLNLKPAIPGWLFTNRKQNHRLFLSGNWQNIEIPEKTFSFMFLGEILVVYHNKNKKDTFGEDSVKPVSYEILDLAGISKTYKPEELFDGIAEQIRQREVARIDVILG